MSTTWPTMWMRKRWPTCAVSFTHGLRPYDEFHETRPANPFALATEAALAEIEDRMAMLRDALGEGEPSEVVRQLLAIGGADDTPLRDRGVDVP